MSTTSKTGSGSKRRLVFDDDSDGSGKQPPAASGLATEQSSAPNTTRKQGIEAFLTSPGAKKKKTVVVTPIDERKEPATPEYVPKYIHKNVEYCRKGQAKLSPSTLQAFQLVEDHFAIPKDIEQNRVYGPLSGTSYEELVIRAYTLGKLTPKDSADGDVAICTSCATVGHKLDDCPDLL
jgi:hypothetical protein